MSDEEEPDPLGDIDEPIIQSNIREKGGKEEVVERSLANEVESGWADAERNRGIFTTHDRKYLLGEKDLSGQDRRNARYRIRERLRQSLYDLYLVDFVTNDDLGRVINEDELITGKLGTDLACRLLEVDSEATLPVETLENYLRDSLGTYITTPPDSSGVTKTSITVEIQVTQEDVPEDADSIAEALNISEESAENIRQDILNDSGTEVEINHISQGSSTSYVEHPADRDEGDT